MKLSMRVQVLIAVAPLMSMLTAAALSQAPSDCLASPESFAAIADTAERSAARARIVILCELSGLGRVLSRVLIELRLAARRAEIKRLALVDGRAGRLRLLHLHAADGIFGHER